MAQNNAKQHVSLALFGCVRCGRFLFAPSWYELDRDVVVCTCEAWHYKTTNVRAPDHVHGYWDAQCAPVYTFYRRRLKRHAPPLVHVERLAGDFAGWDAAAVEDERENEASLDGEIITLAAVESGGNAALTSSQQNPGSVLHACRSALNSWFTLAADVERENKGKT